MMGPASSSSFRDRPAHPLSHATILQIVPDLQSGEVLRTMLDITTALTEAGATSLIACEGGRMVSELQAKGGIWIPFPAGARNPLTMALNVRRLAHLIEAERVDLIHAHSRAPGWVAYGATRLTKTPFVTTFHPSYATQNTLKLRYNSVMARGDAVITSSLQTADLIARLYPPASGRVYVVHHGTDFRLFAPNAVHPSQVEALRREWRAAPDDRIVLLAGRLTPGKGQKVLIEAARLLIASGLVGTKFILAGDDLGRGSHGRELDKLIEKARLKGIVARAADCEDRPAALLAASVAVVPSTEPQALGRVPVEAQAMGTPVVVSDLGAAAEIVLAPPAVEASARTGWLVPPGDAIALARAISAALGLGAAARDALSLRARAHVTRHFSHEHISSETLAIYAALLEPGGR